MPMNARQIREFISAGRAVFTIQSVPTGRHYTYQVRRGNGCGAPFFVSLLTGGDSEFTYLGVLHLTSGKLLATAASKLRKGSPAFDAMNWFARELARTPADGLPRDVIFRHEGACGRCGRPLTHPESIDTGLGPDCAAMLGLVREPTRGPHGGPVRHLPERGASLHQILAERRAAYVGTEDLLEERDTAR